MPNLILGSKSPLFTMVPSLQILGTVPIFVLGVCLGSFLNCVIYRLEKKQSFLKGRSFCPKCHHQLTFLDLIPILSFIFLKGKCRYCGEKISWHYPLVELASGVIFLLNFWHLGFRFDLLSGIWFLDLTYLVLISCFLIIIFVYDFKYYLIPDKIIWPAIGISLIFNLSKTTFFPSLLTGLAGGSFFFLIWLISQGKWMGFGDVKLAFLLGLFLGFPKTLLAFFLSFLIGAIIGIGLVIFGKKKFQDEIPFGPFLISSGFLSLFWGEKIISYYFKIFG